MSNATRGSTDTKQEGRRRYWFRWSLLDYLERQGPGVEVPWIGYRIFKWLLALIALLLVLVALFAWATYPRLQDIQTVISDPVTTTTGAPGSPGATAGVAGQSTTQGDEALKAWQDARATWVTQVKDMGQAFLLTPAFPLLAAVIGYILGRQGRPHEASNGDASGSDTKQHSTP